MKLFLDTEFTDLSKNTSLISIGLVSEHGNVFYAELTDYDKDQINSWHSENVIPNLSGNLKHGANAKVQSDMFVSGDQYDIGRVLRNWLALLGKDHKIEVWADVLAWDWVLFCELFGGAFGLPSEVHYIPRDLSTLLLLKGIDIDIEREQLGKVDWSHPALKLAKHHALYDALLEKSIYESLTNKPLII